MVECGEIRNVFDKVLHGKLAWMVRSFGIQGEPANWIQNSLHGRKQRMKMYKA